MAKTAEATRPAAKGKATLHLYEIAAEYKALADKLANLDLDAATVADTLDAEIGGDLIDKIGNVVAVAASFDAEAAIVAATAKKQADRAKALANRAAGLREYVLHHMEAIQLPEVKRPDFLCRVRENPGSVIVDHEDDVPELYITVVEVPAHTERTLDKTAIAQALRTGVDVPGCRLHRTNRLEIK